MASGVGLFITFTGNLPGPTSVCTCVLGPAGMFLVVDCLGQRAHTFPDLLVRPDQPPEAVPTHYAQEAPSPSLPAMGVVSHLSPCHSDR